MSSAFRLVAGTVIALALRSIAVQAAVPAEDTLLRAMRDELARSTSQLTLESNAPPYFAAYRIEELAQANVVASFGSIVTSDGEPGRKRTASAELRVGSPQLDQTYFLL
jgi:hypothetical protein